MSQNGRSASSAGIVVRPHPVGAAQWQGFDPEVLGGHYTNHHPAGPRAAIAAAPRANAHPILGGISFAQFSTPGSLYQVSPLEKDTTVLLTGTIPGEPAEPVAWTRLYGPKRARVFYTSLGHPDDFKTVEFRRLLVNGIAWALGNVDADVPANLTKVTPDASVLKE